MVRIGVFRDLIKSAEEYSSEFDELMRCFLQAKFVVVYFISPHERDRMSEILSRIEDEGGEEALRPHNPLTRGAGSLIKKARRVGHTKGCSFPHVNP